MPKLPTEDSLQATVPRASRGVVDINPAPLDRSWEGLGEIGQLIDKEFERIEDLRVNDALNQLRERRIDLSVGENGFTQKKAGAVVAEPVLDNFQNAFSQEVDTIGGALQTNRARQAFQQRAAAESNAYRMDLIRHVSAQTDAYQETVFASTMETGARTLVLNATKPSEMLAEVARLSDAVEGELDRKGYEAGTPEAEKVREAFRQEALGGALTTAVATLLDQDRTADAERVFNEYEKMGIFTAKQIASIKPKLQSAKDWSVGSSLGEEAFSMLVSGKSATAIESYMNKRAKSPSELNSARTAYGRMLTARNTQWAENADGAYKEILALSGEKYNPANWFQVRQKYIDRMDPTTVIALDKAAEQEAKGERVVTDWVLFEDIIGSARRPSTSEEFMQTNFAAKYGDRIAPAQLQTLINLRDAMVVGRGDPRVETIPKIVSNIAKAQRWKTNSGEVGKFSSWLADKVREEMQRTDRRYVPDVRINELAREGLENVEYEEAGMLFGTNTRKVPRFEYELMERDGELNLPSVEIRARDIPAAFAVRMRQRFIEQGRPAPTPEQMLDLYQRHLKAVEN